MKVRDLIARLSALRVAGLLDEWGEELVGMLKRQAARGQGPTERQRFAAIALLKRLIPRSEATLWTGSPKFHPGLAAIRELYAGRFEDGAHGLHILARDKRLAEAYSRTLDGMRLSLLARQVRLVASRATLWPPI